MRYIISFLLTSAALPVMAEVPQVVTDVTPVHSLVAQVMGDLGQPVLLLDKGADAHSFQMRPSQAAALQDAGLVVWLGPEMTPWLDRALDGLTTAPTLGLLAAEGTFQQPFGTKDAEAHDGHQDHGAEGHETHKAEEHADHGHEHEEGHDHEAEAHEGHDHEGLDPHAWLDPANAQLWLGLIAAELAKIDPENAATYAANAKAAQDRITALDAEVAATLAPVKDRAFVLFHDAYGYFTSHYGLTVAATLAMGDAAAPGAGHMAEVQALLASSPVCLHPEANHDSKGVEQLAAETGAKLGAALDPEGAMVEPGPDAYGALFRALAKGLADCARP
jgi:zinc transport system substrate-binding protein